MAKYIDAEKLKEEIARQINALLPSDWIGTPAAVYAYSKVVEYIDSLQQEQPEVECKDLEEAAMNYIAPIENEDANNTNNSRLYYAR